MTLKDIYSKNTEKLPVISFEIFPPKNDEDGLKLEKLMGHLAILKQYNPAFISLTYGAGGTTQNTSLGIIERVQKELGFNVMPHFTCVNAPKNHVKEYLKDIIQISTSKLFSKGG